MSHYIGSAGKAGSTTWISCGPTAPPAPKPQLASVISAGCGGCPAHNWASSPGRPTRGTADSPPGTTGGRHTFWTTWSTPSCGTRPCSAVTPSPDRSAGTDCAISAAGPTTTTTTWRGWRWPSNERGGWLVSHVPQRWRHSPTSSSPPGCPRTAAESPGENKTSSSTHPPTGRLRSSWSGTCPHWASRCAVHCRWPTGSTTP